MKFTQIPEATFKQLQLNAGVLCAAFAPASGELEAADIIGATTGGLAFEATPSFVDLGEDIDNCPKNMKELKQLDTWEVKMSGTFVTINPNVVKSMLGAADITDTKITPRNTLADIDFSDLWWVGDYSDKNGETNGGFVAIHMMNSLSTGGFKTQSSDKAKGNFAFEYTAHYSIAAPDTVPFEVYIKSGAEEGL